MILRHTVQTEKGPAGRKILDRTTIDVDTVLRSREKASDLRSEQGLEVFDCVPKRALRNEETCVISVN